MLFDDSWDFLVQDDDSGGGTNALIRYTLPYTGLYTVAVNSYFLDEGGAYRVSLQLAERDENGELTGFELRSSDFARALQLIARLEFADRLSPEELDEVRDLLTRLLA